LKAIDVGDNETVVLIIEMFNWNALMHNVEQWWQPLLQITGKSLTEKLTDLYSNSQRSDYDI